MIVQHKTGERFEPKEVADAESDGKKGHLQWARWKEIETGYKSGYEDQRRDKGGIGEVRNCISHADGEGSTLRCSS